MSPDLRERDPLLAEQLARLDVPEHRPDFLPELREELARARRPRARRLRLPYAAAAAAAAVALALVAFDATRGTDVATAAEVRTAVRQALASVETVAGILAVREQPGGAETRWSVLLDARGNFWMEWLGSPTVLVYDASRHVKQISDTGYFMEWTGASPGPPDLPRTGTEELRRGLGSVIAALGAAGDAEVREVEYRGRPAWVLRTPTHNPGEEHELTVDRATGLPVRDVTYRNGAYAGEWRIDELRTGVPAPAARFRLEPGAGQEVSRFDMGFRRVPLEEVAGRARYRPLVPAWLPDGFELVDVAVAARPRPTGHEQRQNPASSDAVSLAYRRGLDELVVTTRRVGPDPAAWSDPVTIGDLSRAPERVTLARGPLAGREVEVVLDPGHGVPHLWGLTDSLVVTVAGDAGRDELVRIAESLRAR